MKIVIDAEALEIAEFIERLQRRRNEAMAATNACACGKYTKDSHTDNMATAHKGMHSF